MVDTEPGPDRAEIEAVLDCVRCHLGAELSREEAALFRSDLDWDAVGRLARRHYLRPPVYTGLPDGVKARVPTATREQWREQFELTVKRNLQLAGELAELLDALSDRGIQALPFKGPVLAGLAYRRVSSREFGDLDILVREDDATAVKQRLEDRGYEPQHELPGTGELTRTQEVRNVEFGRESEFFRESDRLSVDLHWRILPRRSSFPVRFEDLWKRRQSVSVGGNDLPSPSTADTLLITCVHGNRHCWQWFRAVCDTAALIANRRIDWETVVRRADELGCRRRVGIGLQLAREHLGADVPRRVAAELIESDPKVPPLVETASERLFGSGPRSSDEGLRFKYAVHERRRDRIAFLARWGLYPHRKEIEWVSLPGPLKPLYYLVRPVRLLRKAGSRVIPTLDGRSSEGR